jgi:hypothetical protein
MKRDVLDPPALADGRCLPFPRGEIGQEIEERGTFPEEEGTDIQRA